MTTRETLRYAFVAAAALCAGLQALPLEAATCQREVPVPTPVAGVHCTAGGSDMIAVAQEGSRDGTRYTYKVKLVAGLGAGAVFLNADGTLTKKQGGGTCPQAGDERPADAFFGVEQPCLVKPAFSAVKMRIGTA